MAIPSRCARTTSIEDRMPVTPDELRRHAEDAMCAPTIAAALRAAADTIEKLMRAVHRESAQWDKRAPNASR